MGRRVLGGALLVAACGAEVVPRETVSAPTHALGSAVVDEDDGGPSRPRIRTPEVDCRKIDETGYRRGKPFALEVVTIDDDLVEERTANAYWAMRRAAAEQGIELAIYSGFRTPIEQEYFYRCYKTCACNGCSPAAKPGRSNHQSGAALDIAMIPGAHDWLVANANRFGFVPTVPREPWHWEYRPGPRTPKFRPLCPSEPLNRGSR
jgi:hypothetical protein